MNDNPPPSYYEPKEEFVCYLNCDECNKGKHYNCADDSECHLYG